MSNSRQKSLKPVKYTSLWFALRATQSKVINQKINKQLNGEIRMENTNTLHVKCGQQTDNNKPNSNTKSNKKQIAVCLNESNMSSSCNASKNVDINVIRIDDNRALILMKSNRSQYELTFGSLRITSLNPNVLVCVNGFNLIENHAIDVMAVFGYRIAFVCKQIEDNSNTDDKHFIRHNIESQLTIDSKFIDIVLDKTQHHRYAVILIERLSSSSLLYLESINSYSSDINAKFVWFEIERTETSIYLDWEKWDKLFNDINIASNDVILVCGGKDVGKSSLIRFLINRYLSKSMATDESNDGIYVVDCDPGQTEFTCSAQLSLTNVKKPLLSPPYLNVINVKPIISSALGFINVSKNPNFYLKCVVFLINYFTNNFKSKSPLIINTMGWVKDLGLALLIDIIKLTQPTRIIQIDCVYDERKNITIDLSAKRVARHNDSVLGNHEFCYLNYKLTKNISSFVKSQPSQAKRYRNLSQLAYISQFNEIVYKPIAAITPIKVNWSQVYLHIVNDSVISTELVLDILNCCWVQLCKIDETNVNILSDKDSIGIRVIDVINENQCYGSAIIRQIDIEEKCFYLISPESLDTIKQINCIVRPDGVTLPPEILSEQFQYSLSTNIPYISLPNNLNGPTNLNSCGE